LLVREYLTDSDRHLRRLTLETAPQERFRVRVTGSGKRSYVFGYFDRIQFETHFMCRNAQAWAARYAAADLAQPAAVTATCSCIAAAASKGKTKSHMTAMQMFEAPASNPRD